MTESKAKASFDAFAVEGEGDKAFWTKIGAAWPHEDNKGYNLQLTAMPFTGRVALRIPKVKDENAKEPKRKSKTQSD